MPAPDFDDLPFVGLMYPGFDVYLAHTAGLIEREFTGYTALAGDPVYGRRMREHTRLRFAGRLCAEFPFAHSCVAFVPVPEDPRTPGPVVVTGHGPVPAPPGTPVPRPGARGEIR